MYIAGAFEQFSQRIKHLFMKSSIKIALGMGNTPEIQFKVSGDTEDMRDQVCRQFTDHLQHSSKFCTIMCDGASNGHADWTIKPIGGLDELKQLQKELNETIRLLEADKS